MGYIIFVNIFIIIIILFYSNKILSNNMLLRTYIYSYASLISFQKSCDRPRQRVVSQIITFNHRWEGGPEMAQKWSGSMAHDQRDVERGFSNDHLNLKGSSLFDNPGKGSCGGFRGEPKRIMLYLKLYYTCMFWGQIHVK